MKRPQKITLGEMRAMGIRGLLVYCSDYKCSHNVEINADQWPDDVRLSDLEPLFTCQACGLKGAEARADFNWASRQNKSPLASPVAMESNALQTPANHSKQTVHS